MRAWLLVTSFGLSGCLFLDHAEVDGAGASGASDPSVTSVGGSGGAGTGGVTSGGAGGSGGCGYDGIDNLCLLASVTSESDAVFADALAVSRDNVYFTVRYAESSTNSPLSPAHALTIFRVPVSTTGLTTATPIKAFSLPVDADPLFLSFLGVRPDDGQVLISFAGAPGYEDVLQRANAVLKTHATSFSFVDETIYAALADSSVLVQFNGFEVLKPEMETGRWRANWVGASANAMFIGVRDRGDGGGALCNLALPSGTLSLSDNSCVRFDGGAVAFDWNADAVYARTVDAGVALIVRVSRTNEVTQRFDTVLGGPIAASRRRVWFADGNGGISPRTLRCATDRLAACPREVRVETPLVERISAVAVEPMASGEHAYFLAEIEGNRVGLFRYSAPLE